MDNTVVCNSKGFGRLRAFWMASLGCLALGFSAACAAHTDAIEDQAVQDDTGTVKKAVHLSGSAGGTDQGCRQKLVPCNPPIEVNGRQIMCLEEVCDASELDARLDDLDLDSLDGRDGFPLDPSPLPF